MGRGESGQGVEPGVGQRVAGPEGVGNLGRHLGHSSDNAVRGHAVAADLAWLVASRTISCSAGLNQEFCRKAPYQVR